MEPFPAGLRPSQQTPPHRAFGRALSVMLVVVFHGLAVYALATGLAQNFYRKAAQELQVAVFPPKMQEVKALPPPPPAPLLKTPPPPYVPPPIIVVQSDTPAVNTITVQNKVASLSTPAQTGPARPAPTITVPALISGGAAKCADSYYPIISRRLNQSGTTTVMVHVGADGGVSRVDLVISSGFDSLDRAALNCIQSTWRYRPAMQDGKPVAVQKRYNIEWVLN